MAAGKENEVEPKKDEKMKTQRMILAALCGVAMLIGTSSCKKEKQENENEGEMMRIEVSVGGTDGNTKTHLVHDGNKYKVAWDTWDAFNLFPIDKNNGSSFRFSELTEGSDGTTAIFEGHHPGNAPYYGCYPSGKVSCESPGVYKFTIDETQAGIPETVGVQTATANAGPMVGYMKDDESGLVFQNAMSWLKVGLIGDVTIKRVTLTDNDGKPLHGTLTVTCRNERGFSFETSMSGSGETANRLEIVSNVGYKLHPSQYTYFWFQVPTGSLERLKLAAYTSTANGANDVLNLEEKQIAGGINGNTILTAEVQKMVLPPGVLPGLYTVDLGPDGQFGTDDDRKVFFSQSNLYWNGNSFNFETNQWDYPTSWVSNHVGFFFWSKTESVAYASTYSDSGRSADDIFFTNATETTPNENFHVNGETGQNQWRVLSESEWNILFTGRIPGATAANYKTLTISRTANTVSGIVLLPDNSTASLGDITETDHLAKYNAVFFPATGNTVNGGSLVNPQYGQCWASSPDGIDQGCYARFWTTGVGALGCKRYFGLSIRLVRDAKTESED